jgi:hypothetical protein
MKRPRMKKTSGVKKRVRLRNRSSVLSPFWIGVFPKTTSAAVAHDAVQDVLALLKDYQITDINIY